MPEAECLSIAWSWKNSWVGDCTSGSPSTTKTGIDKTTIHPTWNCGSKHNRRACVWRMWRMSTALSWWPHDSAFENSKINFHTVLPKLLASFGVSRVGLTLKEA